jgi:hypothetical protein
MLVVLLSTALVVTMSNSQSAFGQRIKIGGGSNQSDKDKDNDRKERKDKDSDDDNKDQQDTKNRSDQGNSGNQKNAVGNNGSNRNNSNNGNNRNQNNSNDNPNKTGNSQFQPFIQGGRNQSDKDKQDDKDRQIDQFRNRANNQGQNNQGQGGTNKIFVPGQQGFPGQGSNQQVIIGPGAGRAEPANRQTGRWQGDKWEGSRKMDNWSRVFGHNKKPFTSEWYDEHPRAWKYNNNNNKSNVWVVATVPGVYSWLNWGNAPQQYRTEYNNGPRFDPSIYGEWYPLGVYSMMTGPDDVGTRILQLAVDRRGRINGNYYDMITDSDNSVSGDVQQQTQRAEWFINQNPNVRFRSSILRLVQPEGSITVQLPGGEQRWQFVRLEN